MFTLNLVPELDHSEEAAGTLIRYGKSTRVETAVGVVRGTGTLRIQIGDQYLTVNEVKALEEALKHARQSVVAYSDVVSGHNEYRIHREGDQIICEHRGVSGPLRLSVKLREHKCYSCKTETKRLWVPVDVHGPWKRRMNVCAKLCETCVERGLQSEHRRKTGLRAVGA